MFTHGTDPVELVGGEVGVRITYIPKKDIHIITSLCKSTEDHKQRVEEMLKKFKTLKNYLCRTQWADLIVD